MDYQKPELTVDLFLRDDIITASDNDIADPWA